MDQVLFGGSGSGGNNQMDTTNTEYNVLQSGLTLWGTDEVQHQILITTPGVIANLDVTINANPGGGSKSYKFTLFVDGVASALTVTIAGGDTAGADTTNKVTVSAGQSVSIESVPTDTPTGRSANWAVIFTSDNARESLLMGGTGANALSTSATEYDGISGLENPNATLSNREQLNALAGIIKNFYVKVSASPGTDPDGYKFTIYKNGSATTLTVTITDPATTGNDTSNSFTIVATDQLVLEIEPLNTPSATPTAVWGVTVLADTDGESAIIGGSVNNLHETQARKTCIVSKSQSTWSQLSPTRNAGAHPCTIRHLYVKISGRAGVGSSGYRFSVDTSTESGGPLNLDIVGDDTTGNNTSVVKEVFGTDLIVFGFSPLSTPDLRSALWGMVQFTGPQGSSGGSAAQGLILGGFI